MKKDLRKREEELFQMMIRPRPSTEELIEPYKVPPTINKILELQDLDVIPARVLEFELYWNNPITPSSKDIIPFAHTGGDSCHFGFITDYGFQPNLENCPIAFISPTDSTDSNFLVARNLTDFLTLIISIEDIEFLRFKDIYSESIDSEINAEKEERLLEMSAGEIKQNNKVKQILKSEFDLTEIEDFYKYFRTVRKDRFSGNCHETMDGYGLSHPNQSLLVEITGSSIDEYVSELSKTDRHSKLVGIRNAPYKFKYYRDDYALLKSKLVQIFDDLNLLREQRMIEKELEDERILNEYLDVRKQRLENER